MSKILSLDLGVTSCGFSVLNQINLNSYELIDYGVVMRDNPNDSGTQNDWKEHIQSRTLKEKRKKRIKDIKSMFLSLGFQFVEEDYTNLWELRALGVFERKLKVSELFAILRYLAKHRGYKSLKMEDLIAEIEAQKKIEKTDTIEIIEPNSEEFAETLAYLDALKNKHPNKTIAQIIWDLELKNKNPNFRNHNNYKYIIRREDTQKEIEKIIETQFEFGFFENEKQAKEFEKAIINIIIPQEPVLLNPNLINNCLIFNDEKCAPRYSYTFDIFNFYKHINDLKIGKENATEEQKELLVNDFETKINKLKNIPSYSIKEIKKILNIKDDIKISGLKETKIVQGKSSLTYLLKFNFLANLSKLDEEILKLLMQDTKYFDELLSIFHLNINPVALIKEFEIYFQKHNMNFESEKIKSFALSLHKHKVKGTCAYSFKALNELLAYMKDGKNESTSKEILGVSKSEDYTKYVKGIKYLKPINKEGLFQYEKDENIISNHVVKSLISWSCRVIVDLHDKYGPFDVIKLESTRELSQPESVKKDIKSFNDKNEKEWESLKERYKKHFEELNLNIDNNKNYLLKLRLWEQQGGVGIYSGQSLGIIDVLSNKTEIEHIVPRESGGSSAEYNLALDTVNENALKGKKLPLDYLIAEKREVFLQTIDKLKKNGKINFKKLLNLKAQSLDEVFKEVKDDVSFHSTSYMEKLLGEILKRYYPFTEVHKENQRVIHISARATSYLRKILSIKSKSRDTNFHHAEDAILIGCMSKSYLQNISTNFEKNYELDKEKAKDNFKKIVPLLNGASPNEVFAHLRKSYMENIEENPFYKNVIDSTLRVPSYWVSKKPIGTMAHDKTIQQNKELNPYYVPYTKFVEDFLGSKKMTFNYKLTIESFIKNFNERFLNKIYVFVTNPNDYNSKAFLKKRDEVIEILKKAPFVTSKDEQNDINKQLRNVIKTPIIDVNGNTVKRIRRIGLKAFIPIRNGVAYTAPSLVCLRCSFKNESFRINRLDIRNYHKNKTSLENQIDLFNNDFIELFNKSKETLSMYCIGLVQKFTTNGNRLGLGHPKYPSLLESQPESYKTKSGVRKEFSISSICGIKKYKVDATGKVLGFYYLGRIMFEEKELFSKVVTFRKI